MILYQTNDMESAIRTMAARNPHSVVNTAYKCNRRIKMRGAMIYDVLNAHFAWALGADIAARIARWQESGGVLFYRGSWIRDRLPPADALLFVECPFQHYEYENLAERIRKEVIIYRPPTWELHDEAIDFSYPLAWKFQVLDLAIYGLAGRSDLHPRLEAAIRYSSLGEATSSAFTLEDLSICSGFTPVEVTKLLHSRQYSHTVRCYKCFVPQQEPEDPEQLAMYRILENEPDVHDGTRMLRNLELAARFKHETKGYRVPKFKTFLFKMVRTGDVGRLPDIYVASSITRSRSWSVMWNAKMRARREEWAKMRDLIDQAPEYILSERAEPILYEERTVDISDSVPPLPDADHYFV